MKTYGAQCVILKNCGPNSSNAIMKLEKSETFNDVGRSNVSGLNAWFQALFRSKQHNCMDSMKSSTDGLRIDSMP